MRRPPEIEGAGGGAFAPCLTGITLRDRNTVFAVGHSYGSLVTGKVLGNEGLRPDTPFKPGSVSPGAWRSRQASTTRSCS